MERKMSLLATSALLVLLAASYVPLHSANAQDEIKRTIRVKDKAARVGATHEQERSAGGDAPNLWAVLIGVSRYQYGDQAIDVNGFEIKNLRYANEDAQGVYDFLRSPEGGGFRDVDEGGHMILLKDEEATKASVETALDKLKQTKPDDYFIIFIAAHGALLAESDAATRQTTQVPYFVLYDTNLNNPQHTALRMDSFRKLVGEIPARKGLVLSDTCHSAGVQLGGRGAGSATSGVNARYVGEMQKTANGVGYIWSAGQFEEALELGYLSNGVFTYCLLEGLRGNADANRNGIVTFNELADYVRTEVPKLSEDKQHPYSALSITDVLEGKEPLPLSVVPDIDTDTPSGANQEGTLVIRTPGLDGVDVAIDGAYLGKFDARLQRSVRVKSGWHNLSFTKAGMKSTEEKAEVEPRKSKFVDVNLTFSKSNSAEDSLVDAPKGVLNVYLSEDKEPSKEARELFQNGVDSFKKQKFEEAIVLFNRAIKMNLGAYADAFVFLGRAQQSLERQEAAAGSFKEALRLRPTDYETQTLLAEAQFMAGHNVKDVTRELEAIRYLHPDYDYVRIVLADVMVSRKDFLGAERELRRAINILPSSPISHMILAEAITFQRSKAKQKQAVREAETALELFKKVSTKQVSFAHGLKRLSISHVIFGGGRYIDYAATSDGYRTLADAIIALIALDDSLTDSDTYLQRARASIQEAIKLAQNNKDKERLALFLDVSAQIYVLKLDPANAIKDAAQALNLSSMDDTKAQAHYTLYTAYRSDQKYGKAVEHLQRYLALDGSQLDPRERSRCEAELDRLNRLKEANRQK
jgi:tetratricopeptide (TPR) repeat protein